MRPCHDFIHKLIHSFIHSLRLFKIGAVVGIGPVKLCSKFSCLNGCSKWLTMSFISHIFEWLQTMVVMGKNDEAFVLRMSLQGLQLHALDGSMPPLIIDFLQARALMRRAQHHDPLLRAVGQKLGHSLVVFDATAGLGRDAFIMALAGARVELFERDERVHALLADAMQRCLAEDLKLNWRLHAGCAIDSMAEMDVKPDVVYLDPMFPEANHRAQSKRDLASLQALLGAASPQETEDLFTQACACADQRVVVKRPRCGPPITASGLSYAISQGGSVRYDVYLRPHA